MLLLETRTPFTYGCRLLAAISLTLTITACDGVDEDADENALLADDADDDAAIDDRAPTDAAQDGVGRRKLPGADADAPEGPDGPDGFQAALPEGSAAQPMSHFSWSQYTGGDVQMSLFNENFCFLTRVSGNLDGAGEMVRIYQNGNYWFLGGTSQQAGVSASATCIPRDYWGTRLYPSGEYSWSQYSANPTYMGNSANRICFLTRVTGKFMGGGERVQAYRSGTDWYLGGSSGQTGVAGGARCVNATPQWGIVGPVDWAMGQGNIWLGHANDWACGLTRVQGKFAGAAESVNTFISNDNWYLSGTSNQPGIAGSAACM